MINTMIEADAKHKWCPQVRIARREDIEVNGDELAIVAGCNTDALGRTRVPASCLCIASGCMMWRWLPDMADGELPEGYCGLAGKP
jgi:hypothetical protein